MKLTKQCLDGKALTAAALIFDVRVVEAEKAVQPFADVIHFATVKHLYRIGSDIDAGTVGFKMDFFVADGVSKIEHVAIARTAAWLDRNAQAEALAALVEHVTNLLCGSRGNIECCHEASSLNRSPHGV